MKRYREFMSRGECLLNALLSCLAWKDIPSPCQGLLILLLVLQLGSCAFHWYRYLAYDKK